jgi:hypothetical protein
LAFGVVPGGVSARHYGLVRSKLHTRGGPALLWIFKRRSIDGDDIRSFPVRTPRRRFCSSKIVWLNDE